MKEMSKAISRRLHSPNFLSRYFVGDGVDIGGAPDPLSLYKELFPLIKSVRIWDWPDGDAQYLSGVENETFDFVHSSHCLEHLHDPFEGLRNWSRVIKPGGHLIVTIPDEDLYEQGIFPSTYNLDHKWTFTIHKRDSWSKNSINVVDLLMAMSPELEIISLGLQDYGYRYELPRFDQTLSLASESAIEFIMRKKTREDLNVKGKAKSKIQPEESLRIHFNQYVLDYTNMKKMNGNIEPFSDKSEL
jgi:ubiquinone/menaquinone biosynthesis C-methylase UbiE